ncbi:septum site-determining protein MinC [Candidatus Kinetoplastibacterium desouzaii TCC079E]|uniref:Probable septum site-determining protein MinC n=1 Tax=Candidatus Kinetoplastidibacterium desouzai TCC079E TaxID=1208919 RepID=M1LUX8_9PROT|nr:septum site-determining protein MinC [Candidatus Kinetoplastibacterium desouzaii]AGF47094.1 septum site-determining protein MinC [Candidatus Kinetoplastibacterium desouzaii TCC079E]
MTRTTPSIDFKSTTINFYAPKLVLHTANKNDICFDINKHMEISSHFFKNDYIVIDAQQINEKIDWNSIIEILEKYHIKIIGVTTNINNRESAIECGLLPLDTLINKSTKKDNHIENNSIENKLPSMLIDKPLRSGQKIYANKSDLIIIGMVSQGAEIIADGNIHVYGPLRGKAMAGAQGNTEARIFTTQLDAQLLAIAGVYRIIDTNLKNDICNKPALVKLLNDKLIIDKI